MTAGDYLTRRDSAMLGSLCRRQSMAKMMFKMNWLLFCACVHVLSTETSLFTSLQGVYCKYSDFCDVSEHIRTFLGEYSDSDVLDTMSCAKARNYSKSCSVGSSMASVSDPRQYPNLHLRGGKKTMTDAESRARWYKKFPLGMALYDAAGGVGPGPGDTWYDESNLTRINELIARGANVSFQGSCQNNLGAISSIMIV